MATGTRVSWPGLSWQQILDITLDPSGGALLPLPSTHLLCLKESPTTRISNANLHHIAFRGFGPDGQTNSSDQRGPYLTRANYFRCFASPLSLNSDTDHLGGLPYHGHYLIAENSEKQRRNRKQNQNRLLIRFTSDEVGHQWRSLTPRLLMRRLAERCLPQVLGAKVSIS